MTIEKKFVADGDRKVRVEQYLNKELKRAGYGGMDIVRTPVGTQVTIFAEKPGIVIGKGGAEIEKLKKICRQLSDENKALKADGAAPAAAQAADPAVIASVEKIKMLSEEIIKENAVLRSKISK